MESIEYYSIFEGRWEYAAITLPHALSRYTILQVESAPPYQLLIVGGVTTAERYISDIYCLDVSLLTVQKVANLTHPRAYACVFFNAREMLHIGGA